VVSYNKDKDCIYADTQSIDATNYADSKIMHAVRVPRGLL